MSLCLAEAELFHCAILQHICIESLMVRRKILGIIFLPHQFHLPSHYLKQQPSLDTFSKMDILGYINLVVEGLGD